MFSALVRLQTSLGNRRVHVHFFIQPLGGMDSLKQPMSTKGEILMAGLISTLSRDHLSYSDFIWNRKGDSRSCVRKERGKLLATRGQDLPS